jgi:hypothetical protein
MSAMDAAMSSAALPAFVPRVSTVSAGCNSPVAQVRLRPWSPTSEVEASSPFSPLTGVWVVDRGRRREAWRAAATATGEGHPPDTDLLHVSVLNLPTTNYQKEKKY